ncbi:MAG: hypothetical protein V2B17_07595 [Chloroflexota bacterium]
MRRSAMRLPAAVLLGAFVAALAAGCAGAPGAATPVPTSVPTPVPSALPAGTYTSSAFQPAVTYTVPAGWWIVSDSSDYFALQPVASDITGIHLFRDPLAAAQDAACPTTAEPGVGTLSLELATWIRGLPGMIASSPRIVTIGGLRGVELDLALNTGWTASCPFADGIPTVPLFVGSDGGLRWVVAGSERLRVALLDVPGGGTVVVDVDAFDGTLMDELLAGATPIVQSLSFATP